MEIYEKIFHLKHSNNEVIIEGEWEEKVKLPLVFCTLFTEKKSVDSLSSIICLLKTYLISAVKKKKSVDVFPHIGLPGEIGGANIIGHYRKPVLSYSVFWVSVQRMQWCWCDNFLGVALSRFGCCWSSDQLFVLQKPLKGDGGRIDCG